MHDFDAEPVQTFDLPDGCEIPHYDYTTYDTGEVPDDICTDERAAEPAKAPWEDGSE